MPELVDSLPPTALTVHIQGDEGDTALRIFNPISVARIITSVCGEVGAVKHLRSGGLLVSCTSQDQVRKLLSISSIPSPKPNSPLIPVITSIALNGNTVSGKIYAPWLRGIPLDELLEELKPLGVVQIRKLLNDRTRSHVSLFVLVFLGNTVPKQVKVGYSICQVEQFVPSPMRCYKCFRFNHSSSSCRSISVCGRCGGRGHDKDNCNTPEANLVCPNCKEQHSALNKNCPAYLQEVEICKTSAARNITIQDARQLIMSQLPAQPRISTSSNHQYNRIKTINRTSRITSTMPEIPIGTSSNPPPLINSITDFPMLPGTRLPTNRDQSNQKETCEIEPVEYDFITPWQRPRPKHRPQASRVQTDTLDFLELPDLNKDNIPSSATYTASQAEPQERQQPTSQSRPRLEPQPRMPRPHSSPVSGLPFGQLLYSLVPILLRLFLTTTDSSRLDCIHELGAQLNFEAERISTYLSSQ